MATPNPYALDEKVAEPYSTNTNDPSSNNGGMLAPTSPPVPLPKPTPLVATPLPKPTPLAATPLPKPMPTSGTGGTTSAGTSITGAPIVNGEPLRENNTSSSYGGNTSYNYAPNAATAATANNTAVATLTGLEAPKTATASTYDAKTAMLAPPVAVADGVASAATRAPDVVAGTATAGTANAFESKVNDATDTVEGRTASLIDANSPLMQRAAQLARQQANATGNLNSSAGQYAVQSALYDRAIQIATPDAAEYSATRRANTQALNTASLQNAQLLTDVSKFNVNAALQAGIVNQDQANKIAQFNAAQAQDMVKTNMAKDAQLGMFNAGQANQNEQFNTAALNRASEFNAASAQDIAKFNIDNLFKAGIITQEQANKMSMFNADQVNQLDRLKTDIAGRITTANIGASASLASAQISANASMSNAQLSARTQTALAQLDTNTRLTMQGIGNDFQALLQANSAASSLFANGLHDIAAIQSDTRLSPDARDQAVANYQAGMRNGLGLIGTMGKIPNLNSLVDFAGPKPSGDTTVTNTDGSQTVTHSDGTTTQIPKPIVNNGGGDPLNGLGRIINGNDSPG